MPRQCADGIIINSVGKIGGETALARGGEALMCESGVRESSQGWRFRSRYTSCGQSCTVLEGMII